jgi:hypothetical protein
VNISARYLCQGKAEEGDDAVASLTDDNMADGNSGKSFDEI